MLERSNKPYLKHGSLLILASLVWAFIIITIKDVHIGSIFSLAGTTFLGVLYGFATSLNLRRFGYTNLFLHAIGLCIGTVIALLIASAVIVPACRLLVEDDTGPIICLSARGRLLDALAGQAIFVFLGSWIGHFSSNAYRR